MSGGGPGDGQPVECADFTVVERTLEAKLRALGLEPVVRGDGLASGVPGLSIRRTDARALRVEPPPGTQARTWIGASVALEAALARKGLGSVKVADLVTTEAETPEGALAQCAAIYFDLTLLALKALLEGRPLDGQPEMRLAALSARTGRTLEWPVYAGRLDLRGAASEAVAARLAKQPPTSLVLNTLTSLLADEGVHWCKIHAAQRGETVRGRTGVPATIGVSIDGRKSADAELEMRSKLGRDGPIAGAWEFRQFLVMHPAGPTDPSVDQDLRARTKELLGRPQKPKTSLWSKLLGK